MELLNTDPQICLVELVRDIPAQRTELSPLLNGRVEETQPEQQLLKGGRLLTRVEELHVADRIGQVGSGQVGFETLGRLVRHLDAVLEDWDREGRRGVTCQPQPKVGILSI